MRWIGFMLVFGLLAAPATAQITINEIRIDQPSGDVDEYFELAGPPGASLTGMTYITIGDSSAGVGNGGRSGEIERAYSLDGHVIAADGFFLAALASIGGTGTVLTVPPDAVELTLPGTDQFENGDNVTHLLVTGFTGTAGDNIDDNKDGVPNAVLPWSTIVDSLALIESVNPPTDPLNEWSYTFSGNALGPDGFNVPGHAYRQTDGSGAWLIGTFTGGLDTPGRTNEVGPAPVAAGKFTAARPNPTATPVDLCITGTNTPLVAVVVTLPAHGTLTDGTGALAAPRAVSGTLTYTPTGAYSGLDSFTFQGRDSLNQLSGIVTQEIGVQATGNVFISEIMHRPAGNDDIYEFVEIYNKGGSAVSLGKIDSLLPGDSAEKITDDNLLGTSIPGNSVRILAPTNPAIPDNDTAFRCQWQLNESIIIRVPLDQWEQLFQSAGDTEACPNRTGSRVALFSNTGALLDVVDLAQQLGDCASGAPGSYALLPFLDPPLDNFENDEPGFWGCGGSFSARTGAEFEDFSTITAVPIYKPAVTTPEPCVRGACCTREGGCVDDLFLEECLELTCQGSDGFDLWREGEVCSSNGCNLVPPALQTPQKCCLPGPAANCADLTDCECTRVGGNADSGTCASDPTCLPTDGIAFNELDYDQVGTDSAEFVEVFGTAGLDLTGWTIEFHNANVNLASNTLLASRTVLLELAPGGVMPTDGGGLGYLVVGANTVPNYDIDLCGIAGFCTNLIENGGPGVNGDGDGIVLLHNGVVVEAISYAGSNGFFARGGDADGAFLPDIGVADTSFGGLQRLPNGQAWTLTPNITPGQSNALGGACCSGVDNFTCTVVLPGGCGAGVYQGDGTYCDPINPCLPAGACCLPSGVCLDGITSNGCALQGGEWHGDDSFCPDVVGFVECLDASGPGDPFATGCESFDLSAPADGDVDLRDFWVFQRDQEVFCTPDPTGACCRVDGQCVINNQFDCERFAGVYHGNASTCPTDPPCEPIAGAIRINEILANEAGADTPPGTPDEFIELFGATNAPLDGYSVIIVDGDTGGDPESINFRRVTFRVDLDGQSLDASGYFVMGTGATVTPFRDAAIEDLQVGGFISTNGRADDIQHGTQTYAVVATADIEMDGIELTEASIAAISASAVDTVATTDGDAGDDIFFGAPVVTTATVDAPAMAYGQRLPNGADTNTAADWEALTDADFGVMNTDTTPSPGAVNAPIPGACCNGITCSQTSLAGCAFTFVGYSVPCTPNPCAGACCDSGTLACSEVTESACATSGGDYLGGGTTCPGPFCPDCTSILDAKVNADGTGVCITDVMVSVIYDNIFSASNASFFVQDVTGINGITVFGDTDVIEDLLVGVSVGDIVELHGELETYQQSRELIAGPASDLTIRSLGTGTLTPIDRSIASIPATPTVNDDINNVWVRITNAQFAGADVGTNFQSGVSYTIHDASNPSVTMILRIGNSTLPIVGTPIPAGTVDITGVMTTFGVYQLAIFETTDIQ